MKNSDGQAAYFSLQEHYIGEVHDKCHAASTPSQLEKILWESEAAFLFEKFLTQMSQAMKELEDAGQAPYPQQKLQFLLKNFIYNNIQIKTTMGTVRAKC